MAQKRKRRIADYTEHNEVQIIRGGARYFQAIEDIAAGATYSLHLQTYIFDEDETGNRVAEAFMAAARRGVLVYILLDGYASQRLSKPFIRQLIAAGVNIRFFEPLLRSKHFYFGRRMHHKIVVADGHACLVGGANVSNRYNDMPGTKAWLDWALLATGDIATEVDKVCIYMWDRSVFRKKCRATNNPTFPAVKNKCLVRLHRNDWVYKRTQITNGYYELFREAKAEVTIMTSYFFPPMELIRQMEKAIARGVKVRIILTAHADVPLAKYAERYLYNRLYRDGVEVYEYKPNVLHGKTATRDNEWLTVGSYNLNTISAFASIELNLDVLNDETATHMTDTLLRIAEEDCVKTTKEEVFSNLIKKFFYFLSYYTVYGIFLVFTFYFQQHGKRD